MAFKIIDLTCNYMMNPIGIDDIPYFSYRLEAENFDETLKAYQLIVREGDHVVWDSGRVNEDKQILIKYGGEELKPQTKYCWSVSVWNQKGEKSDGESAFFETGRMKPFGWEAKWITSDPKNVDIGNERRPSSTAPYMRKEFVVDKAVKDATLYISGLGYYECFVNGVSVKDTVLDPAFTEYDKATMYGTHKVTSLRQGVNAIGVMLGDGFYNHAVDEVWNYLNAPWRDHSKCILVLKIYYEDGTEEQIVSDKSFKGTKGPIVANDVRALEKYDARLELGDWTMPGYDDSDWQTVTVTKGPGGELVGQYTTPIRVVDTYKPQEIKKISDKAWLVDVGFNTTGWAEISLTAEAGTEITLRYGEEFDENLEHMRRMPNWLKAVDRENFQKDCYIAKGTGVETWHPIFKYNGFRYIVIECESGIPKDLTILIQEVRTDLKSAGNFTCSDEVMNKIQEITCRATKTNFHGMPTDCPHREKNGWTADAHLSAEQLLFNFDGAAAYNRWMDDVIRAQRKSGQLPGIIPSTGWGYNWGSGPAWDSICAIIPYTMYLYCGDMRILEKMYPCVKKYLSFCETMATDNICAFGLPDWCPPIDAWHKQCEGAVTDTAYYYYDTLTASKMAKILGLDEEAQVYAEKANEIRESFRKTFIKRADTELELGCTKCQTSLSCMMYFGLIEEEEKALFLSELIREIHERDDHLDVGVPGIKFLFNALLEAGEMELLVKMVTAPTYPGFGYLISQGATTLWETWHGGDSQNHHMHGDISACFYKGIAGINVDENNPGFKNIIFKPQFVSTLEFAEAEHMTPYGRVASTWKRQGDKIYLELTVPTNCRGELILPGDWRVETSETSKITMKAGKHEFVLCVLNMLK